MPDPTLCSRFQTQPEIWNGVIQRRSTNVLFFNVSVFISFLSKSDHDSCEYFEYL